MFALRTIPTMLTKADDYPIHQTPEPIAYSGSDRNFYDRYFFNGYDPEGTLFFAAALGVYPHLNIMDASFCVVHEGIQYNLHASKHLKMERLDTQVGPIGVEVIEPLQCLSLTCDDAEQGLQAELVFTGRHHPIEEPRFTQRTGTRMGMDSTRMTQNGNYQGWIKLKDKHFELSTQNFRGTRDRSWGIRPVGKRDEQVNPDQGLPQFYWLWAPLNFDDYCSYYHLNADATGTPWNTKAVLVKPDQTSSHPDPHQEMSEQSSILVMQKDSRHAASAGLEFSDAQSRQYRISLVPEFNFYMRGLGYGHPEWGHGLNHGDFASAYEEYVLKDMDLSSTEHFHIQAFCKAELACNDGIFKGSGVLEQLILGPYAPAGFNDIMDLAR